MLGNQLLGRAEVRRLVASHALLAGYKQVEEVVDHDRHLDAVNRSEHTPILRQDPPAPTELTTGKRPRMQTPARPRCARAVQGCSGALLWNELDSLARGRRLNSSSSDSSALASTDCSVRDGAAVLLTAVAVLLLEQSGHHVDVTA